MTREANQLERDIIQRVKELLPSLLEIPRLWSTHRRQAPRGGRRHQSFQVSGCLRHVGRSGTYPGMVSPHRTPHYRIAITQIRIHATAQAFIQRPLETGSTKREAVRLLKRKLANVVYRTLRADTQPDALTQAGLT